MGKNHRVLLFQTLIELKQDEPENTRVISLSIELQTTVYETVKNDAAREGTGQNELED